MIEIKCADAEVQERLAASVGVKADAVWEMIERGERLGFSCARINGDAAELCWLTAPDLPLYDALFRATLNALRADGVSIAYMADETLLEHMVKKGYSYSADNTAVNIADFFANSSCKG